jgi:hypothetical protein
MFLIQKGYDSESKSFRLPVELIGHLEKLAEEHKLSLNQLVIQCLNYAVNNLESGSEEGEKQRGKTSSKIVPPIRSSETKKSKTAPD